jgi:cytochrome c peroxidase
MTAVRALGPTLVLWFALVPGNSPAPPVSGPSFDFDTTPAAEPITPIPAPPPANPLQAALGERLFEDPRLSRGNTRSCLTCHDIHINGAGGRTRSTSLDGTPLQFQTPTVFNAALSFRLSWEGRYRTLEAQITASLVNPSIMGTNMEEVLDKLRGDPGMVSRFEDAFGHGPDARSLLQAIATYERSLLTPGSRFDRWLGGDAAALSDLELTGYRLFKSLGCIACHQGVNIGGNLLERVGIFRPLAGDAPAAQNAPTVLRVPSLRNVAVTPPYFHDGSARTLDDAVRKMSRAQLNSSLSDEQVEAIVAYLRTLTGYYLGRPVGAHP